MQFKQLSLFALASVATAQNPIELLGALPTDLQQYAQGLLQNTAAVAAVEGLITASPVVNALNAIGTAGTNVDPTAAVQTLEAAINEALSAAPSDQRAIVTSIEGVVTSLAATDGLYSDIGSIAGGGAAAVTSGVSAASTALAGASASGASTASVANASAASTASAAASAASTASQSAVASSSRAASSSVSQGLAASPTGMAMGALAGAIGVVAAIL